MNQIIRSKIFQKLGNFDTAKLRVCNTPLDILFGAVFTNPRIPIARFSSINDDLSGEVERAQNVGDITKPTVFDEIICRKVPADIIYEDELCIAFVDAKPAAPVHFLVIPKMRIPTMIDAKPAHKELLGHMLLVCSQVARERDLSDGYRLVINTGRQGSQVVYHLHLHVLGGRQMKWPPG